MPEGHNLKYIKYAIYLPTRTETGRKYSKSIYSRVRKKLVGFCGGITEATHTSKGLWKIGSQVIRDRLLIWTILSSKGAQGDRLMTRVKNELEAPLSQDEILVVRRRVETL